MAIFSRQSKGRTSNYSDPMHPDYRKSTPWALRLFVAICYLLSTVFLILVEIGNINGKSVIRDTYFINLNLANIIPVTVPNAQLINSVARSIGLHDFYQVGLWNYCEGYNDEGITHCSKPQILYWFNPVEILVSELLSGATITLPTEVITALNLVRIASHWMFACFLVGICITFTCIFIAPIGFSTRPRYQHKARRIFCREIPLMIWTFLALLFTAGGAAIATVMFVIFRNAFKGVVELNIIATLGTPMLAFMWIAVGFNLIGFFMQFGTCCGVCCCSGRRKAERKSAVLHEGENGNGRTNGNGIPLNEKPENMVYGDRKRRFGFRRSENAA